MEGKYDDRRVFIGPMVNGPNDAKVLRHYSKTFEVARFPEIGFIPGDKPPDPVLATEIAVVRGRYRFIAKQEHAFGATGWWKWMGWDDEPRHTRGTE